LKNICCWRIAESRMNQKTLTAVGFINFFAENFAIFGLKSLIVPGSLSANWQTEIIGRRLN